MTYTILDTLDRCFSGPFIEKDDWDRNIGIKAAEKLKKYGCDRTYDPKNIVNTDDALADSFFKAAYEFALETGMLCLDTQRIIKVDESDLKERLRWSDVVPLGRDADRTEVRPRKPEERKHVTIHHGGIGTGTSENLWIPIHQAVAQCREVNVLTVGTIQTVYGREFRTGTPLEFLAGVLEAKLTKEAMRRAGRPGMPASLVTSSMTELGQYGGYVVPGGGEVTDLPLTGTISELKTNFHYLNKAVHAQQVGARSLVLHHPIIGGYAGGPEGAALIRVVASLIIPIIYQSAITTCQCTDARYSGNCGSAALWADSIAAQALSRNTNRVFQSQINPVAGPCTEMLLYETACKDLSEVPSGTSMIVGVRSGSGVYTDYWTWVENRFSAEVIRASQGMKRSDANEIVKELVARYDGKLKTAPKGKSFTECIDMHSLRPSAEWDSIHNKVKAELTDLGVPFY